MNYRMPDSRSGRLAWAGAVFLVAGLVLGFAWPLDAAGGGCGKAFAGTSSFLNGPAEGCDAKRAEVRGYAVDLLILGALGVAVAVVLADPKADPTGR